MHKNDDFTQNWLSGSLSTHVSTPKGKHNIRKNLKSNFKQIYFLFKKNLSPYIDKNKVFN